MKYSLLCLALLWLQSDAQSLRVKGPNVFFKSQDVFSPPTHDIKKIVSPIFVTGKSISVTYRNGTQTVYNKSELWGIADKTGRIFRYVNGIPRKITALENGIVIYGQTGRFSSASFSIGLDGELFPCNMNSLRKNFDSDRFTKLQNENPKFVNKYFKFF